jgi:hypothetical protein
MNKIFITAVFLQIFSQSFSQQIPLLDNSNRWILVNNKIDKNEVFLSSYKKAKVKLNTLVLTFAENGKIIYDYETNSKYAENLNIKYLDINVNESSWAFDSLAKTLLLTIQGGYFTLDDFKFQREYTIDEVHDGYILMKSKELIFEDLRKKKVLVNEVRKTALKRVSPNVEMPQILSENKISIENGTKTPKVLADSINYQINSTKPKLNFSEEKTTGFVENEKTVAAATLLSSVWIKPLLYLNDRTNYHFHLPISMST